MTWAQQGTRHTSSGRARVGVFAHNGGQGTGTVAASGTVVSASRPPPARLYIRANRREWIMARDRVNPDGTLVSGDGAVGLVDPPDGAQFDGQATEASDLPSADEAEYTIVSLSALTVPLDLGEHDGSVFFMRSLTDDGKRTEARLLSRQATTDTPEGTVTEDTPVEGEPYREYAVSPRVASLLRDGFETVKRRGVKAPVFRMRVRKLGRGYRLEDAPAVQS